MVSFVGRSGSGKTQFLERLLPVLTGRGYRVGVIKHHAHEVQLDRPGKDTHRLRQAGAERVALSGPGENAYFERVGDELPARDVVARFFGGLDLVLTEGFKSGPFPKVEVARAQHSRELITTPAEGLVAVACDFDPGVSVPRFGLDEANGVADFLEARFMSQSETTAWKAELTVDGREIPMKEFVEDLVVEVVLGLVRTLKGVSDAPAEVRIRLSR